MIYSFFLYMNSNSSEYTFMEKKILRKYGKVILLLSPCMDTVKLALNMTQGQVAEEARIELIISLITHILRVGTCVCVCVRIRSKWISKTFEADF